MPIQLPGAAALTITGRVTAQENGEGIPGVNVLLKGTTTGTTTNREGNYTLSVPDANANGTLVFSFIGYLNEEVPIGNRSMVDVTLLPDVKALSEVVVVGYGEQNSRDVTTAIAQVKAEAIKDLPVTGLDKALTGKVAGVQVMETSGAPGSGINVRIRGTNSISAGNEPLYVVDGIPLSNDVDGGIGGRRVNPLNMINTADIESVEILKDASSAAIYGSRGSNGVVIITTKKGKSGKPAFSYDAYYGLQQTTKKIEMLDAYQFAEMARDARNNTYLGWLKANNKTGSIDDTNEQRIANGVRPNSEFLLIPETLPYLDGTPGLTNTDWQDAVFRTAPMQSHTLSASGGTDVVRFFVSGNYLDQQGIVIGSRFRKLGSKLNLDVNTGRLKVGINFLPTYSEYNNLQTEGRFRNENVVSTALQALPIYPVYNPDGSFNYDNNTLGFNSANPINPVALATLKEDQVRQLQLLGNLYAEYKILKDLTYRLSLGATVNNFRRDYFRPSTLPTEGRAGPSVTSGENGNRTVTNLLVENILTYRKTFGQHSLTALAGYSAQTERDENTRLAGTFPNDLVKTFNATARPTLWESAVNEWSLLSYLSRVQYGFRGKYLLSAALRADGSSRFGRDNKYGFFPSVSAGWIVSEEKFMQALPAVSSLKLRASYGLSGNFQIGNYEHIARLVSDNYVYGPGEGSLGVGYRPASAPNEELGWEKTAQLDFGLDLSLFRNVLAITLDYYNSNTSDLLLNVPVPEISGFSFLRQNVGKVNNRGFEVSLSANTPVGGVKLTNSVNFSANRNRVTDLGGVDQLPIIALDGGLNYITRVGEPVGSYYTLVKEGVYSQADIDNPDIAKAPNSQAGDFRFRDVNGDGIITSGDLAITGNYAPRYTYGLTSSAEFKNFDLSVAVQGIEGNQVVNLNKRYYASMESYGNNYINALERWRSDEQPGDGQTQRANRSATGLTSATSTYHVEDAGYLRVRNVTLGYTLPKGLAGKLRMSSLRVYLSTQNPFTFTSYTGYNPEVSNLNDPQTPGLDYGTYPLAKNYILGVHVNF
ncbi:MAG: TonB-dependent receptor [Cytophagales bacterium]|nr:TonB-dependent receptor [Cytophagales bacterium]